MLRERLTRLFRRSYAEVRWNQRPVWGPVVFDSSLLTAAQLAGLRAASTRATRAA